MKATINPKEISVRYSIRPDVGREFITVDCPDGWDDVKKINRKVLQYDGKRFQFSGWNSDSNEAYFFRPIGQDAPYATIS